jgi:hypothetical protein
MPRPHAPEKRAAVLADVPALGISGAAKKHRIGKATVSRWADAAGVGTVPNERTREAVEAHSARAEELRSQVHGRLWEIADAGSKRELELIRGSKAPDLRSVVGARTRAIHDAELLSGRATARTEHVEPIDAEIARLVEQMTP